MSAADRGWGSGWPRCQAARIKTLVRADGLRLPVHEAILPLVAWLCDETERLGYNLVPGWCWGYACRAIRGSEEASNHSWGLAVDLNAPKNPMGSRLVTDIPPQVVALWEAHGFRWGGRYRVRPDAMHFEFMGTPADAARYVARLADKASPPVIRPTPLPPEDDDMPLTDADLKRIVDAVADEIEARTRDTDMVLMHIVNRVDRIGGIAGSAVGWLKAGLEAWRPGFVAKAWGDANRADPWAKMLAEEQAARQKSTKG